jgi:hypothetical protein
MALSSNTLAGLLGAALRHKVFISYYHKADQAYRDAFENVFGHLFISKSVKPGDVTTDLSTDYIKRLISEGYITDASVVIVLVGAKTYCRKHVDWEISAGLDKKVGGYSGLIAILLPDIPVGTTNQYQYDALPARLADNAKSGYADIYTWSWITDSEIRVKTAIEGAFNARINKSYKIENGRQQLGRNLCE